MVDVGDELVGDRAHGGDVAVLPQRLLDAVEAAPLGVGHVALAGVDQRVEVAEALGDGLDRLVVVAGGGEERLRGLDIARLDGVDEGLIRGDQ